MDGDVWHLVEGRRDDGAPAIFRIRELAPRLELPRIFVVEMPYPITELSNLPNAAAYRRLAQFEEQWIIPACAATGYELVGLKIEEGSFFLYMYGATDPQSVIARLSPFDAALGFYDDNDPSWGEYATLKDLLDQAKAMPMQTKLPPRTATTIAPPRAATVAETPAAAPKRAAAAAAAKRTTRLAKKPAAKKPTKKAAKNKRAASKSAASKSAASKSAASKSAASKSAASKSAAERKQSPRNAKKAAARK
jgi:hypothetical protein